ncbi:unnamed protein product [Closterium sp. Naga37s-1]|nr:unnamed protein product [Closterium sp. Naga37s-1]
MGWKRAGADEKARDAGVNNSKNDMAVGKGKEEQKCEEYEEYEQYEEKEGETGKKGKREEEKVELLPIWESKSGQRQRQLAWNAREARCVVAARGTEDEDDRHFRLSQSHRQQQQPQPQPQQRQRGRSRNDEGVRACLLPAAMLRRCSDAWKTQVWAPIEEAARAALLPRDVADGYWEYMRWKAVQRTLSSCMHVMATQSLLRAVGVGARRSVPAAAALQWVLKDGLGRLGRLWFVGSTGGSFDCNLKVRSVGWMVDLVQWTGGWLVPPTSPPPPSFGLRRLWFVGSTGGSFDCNLKRVRFQTSALFSASLGLDILTPHFPHLFLPLATAANIGKSIGLAAYVATTPPIHRTFALADNLGDISAKGQAQAVVSDNVGLAVAVALGALTRNHHQLHARLPLLLFPLLAITDLLAIRRELQAVPLRSLNKERVQMLVSDWVAGGAMPCPAELTTRESLFFPPHWTSPFNPPFFCFHARQTEGAAAGWLPADRPVFPLNHQL